MKSPALTPASVNAMSADEQWDYHANRSTRGPRDRWYFGGFKRPTTTKNIFRGAASNPVESREVSTFTPPADSASLGDVANPGNAERGRPPMASKTQILQQTADAALFVYSGFAVAVPEVADHLGLSRRAAADRLARAEAAHLVACDVQENHGSGLSDRGSSVGEFNVWQSIPSYDHVNEEEFIAKIVEALGVAPTGKAGTVETTTDSPKETTVTASKTTKKSTPKAAPKATASTKITTAQRNAEAPKGQKWCPRHEQYEPVANFAKNKAAKDGLFAVCKAAEAEDRKRWKAQREASQPAKAVKAAAAAKAPTKSTPAAKANGQRKAAQAAAAKPSGITYRNFKYLPGREFTDEAEFNAALDAAKAATTETAAKAAPAKRTRKAKAA